MCSVCVWVCVCVCVRGFCWILKSVDHRRKNCNNKHILSCCSYYCPSGTHSPIPCPPGTYNPFPAQGNLTGCTDCIAGQACTQEALTEPDSACAPGHYCPIGTVLPTDTDCPAGTYTNLNNLTRWDQCETCPATTACPAPTGGVSTPPVSCAVVRIFFKLFFLSGEYWVLLLGNSSCCLIFFQFLFFFFLSCFCLLGFICLHSRWM